MQMWKFQIIVVMLGVVMVIFSFLVSVEDMKIFEIMVKDKVFMFSEIMVKVGEFFCIKFKNVNLMLVEFEFFKFGFEKVVVGFFDILVNVCVQVFGIYIFFDDFYLKEIIGKVVVQ